MEDIDKILEELDNHLNPTEYTELLDLIQQMNLIVDKLKNNN